MVWWVLVVSSVSSLRWHEKTATLLSTTKTSSNTTYISSAAMESFWLSISLIFISYFFGKWNWSFDLKYVFYHLYTRYIYREGVREITTGDCYILKGDNFRFINNSLLSINFANLPILEIVLFELIISRITIWWHWQILLVWQGSKTLDTFETCI